MLKHEKAVALGEIGLDYHWEIERELQHRVFEEQLKLAKDLDVPVVIHDREAHGDVKEYLRKYKPKGLLHCFSGSVEMLKEVLKLGMSISLGGTVTFKNARVPLEVADAVPLDRLLLETDAPYLSPVPFRGKRNDSSNIIYTAQRIAEIKGVGVQELLDITSRNARELYGIKD
jgi:TatD DNase family protein